MDVKIKPNMQVNYKNLPQPVKDVAEGLETQFAEHLLQEMRKTIPKENEDSGTLQFYNSLLDHERAKLIAQDENGIGLKEVIIKQLYPQAYKQQRVRGETHE